MSVDSIPLGYRVQLAGKWIALEMYTPETLPLRTIAAIGSSSAECIRQLREQGLEPAKYEYSRLEPAY